MNQHSDLTPGTAQCGAIHPDGAPCWLAAGHTGMHAGYGGRTLGNIQWSASDTVRCGAVHRDGALCSLPAGHTGTHRGRGGRYLGEHYWADDSTVWPRPVEVPEQVVTVPATVALVEYTGAAIGDRPPELQCTVLGAPGPTHVVTVSEDCPPDLVRTVARVARAWADQLDEHAHNLDMQEASRAR